jgi:HNH endonuclease
LLFSAVLFAELHWTPGTLAQAEDRAHRIGQQAESVNIMYAVCKDEKYSLDMAMWKMLGRKIGTLGSVIDGTSEQPYLYSAQEQQEPSRGTSGEDELTAFFADTSACEGRRKQKNAPPAKGSIETFFKPKAAPSTGKSKSSPSTCATSTSTTVKPTETSSSSSHISRTSTARPSSSFSPAERLIGNNFMATTSPAASAFTLSTQRNGHAGLLSWTCNSCTFENKTEGNSSDWYTCELCAEPHVREAGLDDDDESSLGNSHADLLNKSRQNHQETLSEKKASFTSVRVGVGMISWTCKECTFQNKKAQNKSAWYPCEMCSEPHVPKWDLDSVDDDDESFLDSNQGDVLASIPAAASRSHCFSAVFKKRSAPIARVSTGSSVEIIEIDSTPAKHRQSKRQPTEVIMLDDDDDDDDESTSNSSERAAPQGSYRTKPSPSAAVPPKKKKLLLQFSVSKNSGRVTIHFADSGGKSSLINFDIEQVLTSETCDALMEAKTNRGKPQRSGPSSSRTPVLCFDKAGVNGIVQRLKRPTDVHVEPFSSELKLFVRSYLSLREVEKKALKDSGESFAPIGLSQSAARIMSRSLVASATTTSIERYSGGAKERAIENQKNGTASLTDEAILKGKACAWCSSDLTQAQRIAKAVYCSQECAETGRLRRGGWASTAIRSAMFALEGGVCQKCNINAHAFYEQITALEPAERLNRYQSAKWRMPASNKAYQSMVNEPKEGDFWQVDHKVAVAEGGGNCGLENLRTLCVPCHRDETEKLRVRLRLASPSKQNENTTNSSGDIANKPAAKNKRKQVDIRTAFFGAASASSQKRLCKQDDSKTIKL